MGVERGQGGRARRVLVLGSTGSIGTQALDVVRHINARCEAGDPHAAGRLEVVGLAARSRAPELFEQAGALGVRDLALADEDAVRTTGLAPPKGSSLRLGPDAPERLVREVECDVVLAAMVGVAGLPATMAAIELGRDVALANKETLVAAGALAIPAARASGSRLLPGAREPAGGWQCLRESDEATKRPSDGGGEASKPRADETGRENSSVPWPPFVCAPHVARVVLTASGGPFRTWTREAMDAATAEQALRHPTWRMGPKVTVDSASLMNKGLELIEAHWLFGLGAARLGVLIHPQSVVHAMVEHADGSIIAQLGSTDMRTPIMHALTGGARPAAVAPRLDLASLRALEFEPPDEDRFPALRLACRAIERGGTAGAALNGANEEAVCAFLRGRPGGGQDQGPAIPFGRIVPLVEAAMEAVGVHELRTLDDVMRADSAARRAVREQLAR